MDKILKKVPFVNGQNPKKVLFMNGQIQKKCHLEMDKNKKVPFTNGQTSIFSLEDAVLWTKKKVHILRHFTVILQSDSAFLK